MISWRLTAVRSRRQKLDEDKKIFQVVIKIYQEHSIKMETDNGGRILAGIIGFWNWLLFSRIFLFCWSLMIIQDLDDEWLIRLLFLAKAQTKRLQSLVPGYKKSVGIYTASIKRAPHSISKNYNFLENLEGRLVNEQTTVFRHYDTVSEYRQLADKQRLQWDRSYSQDTASLYRQPSRVEISAQDPGTRHSRWYTGTASWHRQSLLHASSDETRCWG